MSSKAKTGINNPQLLPLAAMMMAVGLPAAAQAQSNDPAITLAPVVVKGEREQETQGYMATKTRVGKVKQDPHDIPQAVTTLTNQLLEDQQVGSLREALRNVSGLSFNAAEGGRAGDNFNLRGFYTFGDIYLDGIRDTAQYNRETFNLEQIDVLRGAGAMLFGRGQAGGVINQVSKTPLPFDKYKLTASAGTNKYFEVTADMNKRINEGTQMRINLMNRDEGSWRVNPTTGTEAEVHRMGAAFSLALNQDSNNRFWINHYYLKTSDNPDYGISFDSLTRRPSTRVPGSTFYGIDRTFDKSETTLTTFVNEYQFAKPETQLRTQLRIGDYRRSYWARTPSLTEAPSSSGVYAGSTNVGPTRASYYETVTLQSDYSTKFEVNGIKHEFLAGYEFLHENAHRRGLLNSGGTTSLNPPSISPYVEGTAAATKFKSDSHAIYVQDTVEFIPKWKATLGARYDWMDAQYSSTTSPKLKFGEHSLRTALSYHPAENTHYYLGYSDSFSPTADLYQLTVAAQPAERSKVMELGAKWLLMDGNLSFRAALYRAIKDWERSTDLESTASILTKKRRTDGIELEMAGKISDRWEVFSGLALMDAIILDTAENINATTGAVTKDDTRLIGQKARNTPAYTFNIWTTYKLDGGWKIGGGAETKGKRSAYVPNNVASLFDTNGNFNPNTAPAYWRWDAMVAYEQAKWALRLNVKNVFDKLYWDQVYDNGGFAVPGLGRQAVLTAEIKF